MNSERSHSHWCSCAKNLKWIFDKQHEILSRAAKDGENGTEHFENMEQLHVGICVSPYCSV